MKLKVVVRREKKREREKESQDQEKEPTVSPSTSLSFLVRMKKSKRPHAVELGSKAVTRSVGLGTVSPSKLRSVYHVRWIRNFLKPYLSGLKLCIFPACPRASSPK